MTLQVPEVLLNLTHVSRSHSHLSQTTPECAGQPHITLNMLDLTPLFSPSAFPPSYSTPAEPPSPDMPSSLSLSSSSSSAMVFFRGGTGSLASFSGDFDSLIGCLEVV